MSSIDVILVQANNSDVAESDFNIIKQLFRNPNDVKHLLLCNKILIDNNPDIPGSRYIEIKEKTYSCGLPQIVVVIGNYVE